MEWLNQMGSRFMPGGQKEHVIEADIMLIREGVMWNLLVIYNITAKVTISIWMFTFNQPDNQGPIVVEPLGLVYSLK